MGSKPYTHQEFPKWMYHPTEQARIVKDQDELEALGEDWVDTPAKAGQKKPAPVAVGGGVGLPDPGSGHDPDEDDAQDEETADETTGAAAGARKPLRRNKG